MRRGVRTVIVAIGLAAGLVASVGVVGGCGIPDSTDVKIDGAGPEPGSGPNLQGAKPPRQTVATSGEELVRNLLRAPAGEAESSLPRLREYLLPDLRDARESVASSLKSGLAVVRVGKVETSPDDPKSVTVTVKHLGVLLSTGEMTPPTATDSSYTFTVGRTDGWPGYYVLKQLPLVMLDVNALVEFYDQRTIYFWNRDHTALVPDLRYLPKEITTARVPTEVLKMLASGPSAWLEGIVDPLPQDGRPLGNATLDGAKLTMNWSAAAAENNKDDLVTQVAWSLSTSPAPQQLELRVNDQEQGLFETENMRDRLVSAISSDPRAYVVMDGKIRALDGSSPRLLGGAADQNVRWAAFDRESGPLKGAVIGADNVLRVGAGNGTISTLVPTSPPLTALSPPTWLPRSKLGLVAATEGFYWFRADGATKKLNVPGVSSADTVTAVAAAPDGQRIAVVAGGRLYVVPVSVGDTGDALTLMAARPVHTPAGMSPAEVNNVAWSGETTLSVAGRGEDNLYTIRDVTVDGVHDIPRVTNTDGRVTALSVYPGDAAAATAGGVMFEVGSRAYFGMSPVVPILPENVAGVDPSPSAGTSGPSSPTAPFYVY